ncbi:MAG: FHA domain-containing protein [Planctomycetota bacterium]
MRVTLEVRSGLLIGRRFDVVPGPGTVFGRSEQASGFIPHDPEMGDFHFLVQWVEGEPRMKALVQTPTTVNGETVTEAVLAEGDLLHAGRTSFEVKDIRSGAGVAPAAAGAPVSPAASAAPAASPASPGNYPEPAPGEMTGPELLKYLDADDDVIDVAQPGQGARELMDVFVGQEEWPTAFRIRTHLLGPRPSVWWGLLALDHVWSGDIPEAERAACDAAKAWIIDSSEDNRRKAEALGPEAEDPEGYAWLLCCAAFWSEGSLSLPDLPDVPTDSKFSGVAVAGMLHMAAYDGDPAAAEERFPYFHELGAAIERGEHPFPG